MLHHAISYGRCRTEVPLGWSQLCVKVLTLAWEDVMELAIVTVLLIVGASLIPGDLHVVFFR